MDYLNHDNQADGIEAFNSTFRYLDELLNINFEGMVNQIIHLNYSGIKPKPQISRLQFLIYILLLHWICFI